MGVAVSNAFRVQIRAPSAPGANWVQNVFLSHTSLATRGVNMPTGQCKHLRWDYHPASQTMYVCGGDFSAPPYTTTDYQAIMFKYSGNGVWARDYPHYLGTPLHDASAGPLGDIQPAPHCEACFNWIGGDKFLVSSLRTDYTTGEWPALWIRGVSRPMGFGTINNTNTMEYDRSTRKWSIRPEIANLGHVAAEMSAFDASRNLWIRMTNTNGNFYATNVVTGAHHVYSFQFPNHPADGRTPTEQVIYRPVIVGTKCFVYNSAPLPTPTKFPWPVYIFWFDLSALDTPAVRVPMHFHASLWATANPPVAVSEQDMIYVPPEKALLLWGYPRKQNGGGLYNNIPLPATSPESYFVDVDTGATRPGPPLPRGRNGAPYRPNNTMYFPPTQEIIAHGSVDFNDPVVIPGDNEYTIYKRGDNLPSWAAALPLYQWYAIPNTSIRSVDPAVRPDTRGVGTVGPYAKIDAWNSLALRKRGSYLYAAANGGHGDYAGNEVDVICLNAEVPRWYEMRTCTVNATPDTPYYPDGRPVSRHTYTTTHYIESSNRIFLIGCESGWRQSITHRKTDAFSLEINDWDAAGTWPDHPNFGTVTAATMMAQHPETDDIYISFPGRGGFCKFSAASGTYSIITGSGPLIGSEGAVTIDPVRNRFVYLSSNHGLASRHAAINLATGAVTSITLTGPAASLVDSSTGQNSHGLIYEPYQDCYIAKPINNASNLIRINPVTWSCDLLPVTGVAPELTATGTIYHRFRWIPELRGIAYVPMGNPTSSVYFLRTSR